LIEKNEEEKMNSISSESPVALAEMMDEESNSIEGDVQEMDINQNPQQFLKRSSAGSTSSNGTTITSNLSASTGVKRQKDMPPCFVCGAKANGYNFDQITCESCKAFFRRNALKLTEKFRCRNNNNCVINVSTRKRCKRCRLSKCFQVGMRKEWILTEEEKVIKRQKIEQNRRIKKEAQRVLHQQSNQILFEHSELRPNSFDQAVPHSHQSSIIPIPPIHLFHSADRQLYERQLYLLNGLSNGYFDLSKKYPQPIKFTHRNTVIAQTFDVDVKLLLIKDLTRELTQMTTLRLLNFFNLIPEFQTLTQQEKTSILIQNMLAVFMFHGALTYDGENDRFVDHMTGDEPYDAKYLLMVYGPRVYHHFCRLARQLLSATSPCGNDKQSDEHVHTLFLLLRIILLFSSDFQSHAVEHHQTNLPQFKEKLNKIQMHYIEIACRFIHDQFGVAVGRRIFQKLVPLLLDLQKLCSTLANVNLCEMADDDDRSLSSRHNTTTNNSTIFSHQQSSVPTLMNSSPEFHATMISGTSHLNELQKENRAPPPSISSSFSSPTSSSSSPTSSSPSPPLPLSNSPSILSNSSPSNGPTFRNNF